MARIKLHKSDASNPEIKSIFDDIKEKTGGDVPAAYRAFGIQSHILQANWNRTKRILSEGNLPQTLKESIALAVSNANECHFCVNIHRNNLLAQEFTEEQTHGIMNSKSEDEIIDFILKFCVKATKNPHQISDDDFNKLHEYGYSDEDILEMLTVMEMYTGYNKIIVSLGLNTDD